ncbi:hypothetical protein VNI00_007555 [Paramarasmius palmivorus]|uniref:BTB domain-containing protein n=1 Tax=Paramarasmius palmivorus TaxID=297713 RepID=A0AAW0D2T7_9AGAR
MSKTTSQNDERESFPSMLSPLAEVVASKVAKNESAGQPRTPEKGNKRPAPHDNQGATPGGNGTGSPKRRRANSGRAVVDTGLPNDNTWVEDERYADNGGDFYLRVDGTLFLCHLEKLKQLQGFFAELFAVPQPEYGEKQNNLPFCDLTLVTASEMRYVLDYIYGKLKLLRRLKTGRLSLHYPGAFALLKAGQRLNLPTISRAARSALQTLFPCHSTNDDWPPIVHGLDISESLFLRLFPLEAINLFHECELVLYAPMAYYYAAQLRTEDIVSGVSRPDGTKETLRDKDKALILDAKDRLRTVKRNRHSAWLADHGAERGALENRIHGCSGATQPYTGKTCFEFLQEMKKDWNEHGLLDRSDCLGILPDKAHAVLTNSICSKCYAVYKPMISKGIWNGWWELPATFNYGSWPEVHQKQKALSMEAREFEEL